MKKKIKDKSTCIGKKKRSTTLAQFVLSIREIAIFRKSGREVARAGVFSGWMCFFSNEERKTRKNGERYIVFLRDDFCRKGKY